MIRISDSAANEMKRRNKTAIQVRTFFGGCSGYKYELSFPNTFPDNAEILESNGITVITDIFSAKKLKDSIIDFKSTLMNSKFEIKSKTFKRNCHCGTSFSI
ncbi:HesB/IscA family protein [Candidatus Nesciobacter abundans]|uniref:Iron-sulfur cluster assembly accessory protein n=1 Tax=Candidatus Nesciobacter abundans TaxID=2601668 RepID=A0A5C0UI72_9PROT|nr:iron-sulfur cluster assembly accessory protein [Candidatus Nesciobacter abundans]QEK39213.1 iron-sulfur cluster assembly accessory protein [Candidatus Nesciobacter abundans]